MHGSNCIDSTPQLKLDKPLAYPGRNREVKQQITEMTLNGSGVRDIARVLRVSTSTVIRELKKTRSPQTRQSKAVESIATKAG